jgi:imidazolonepropionase-like amidohydrolase/ABC-type multidrug transport system permease subunit
MKAYIAQIRMNLRLTMRDRTVVFFNYLFPLIFFFIFGQLMHAEQGGAVTQIVNMVLTIGVLGSGFFGAGMRSVMDREHNILRRFKVAPITAAPILVSSMVVGLVHYVPVTAVVLVLAHFVYGMQAPQQLLSLFLFVSLGVLAFRAIGGVIGAVANSMQESQIIIQLLYFPMLFLGGATFPIALMPNWLQIVAQFIPTTYLSTGLQGILRGRETILDNLSAAGVLVLTAVVGTFLGIKLFRWEKEEKMRASAKLWLLAVMTPFFLMGVWQAHAKNNVVKGKVLARDLRRSHTLLIRDARLFVGDGAVIDRGAVLVKDGKIAEIYPGPAPDPKTLKADPIEAAGKTLMPGLIDVHVHLGAPGGFYGNAIDYGTPDKNFPRELAAYLYSGVTAVKSVGDTIDDVLRIRGMIASGEKLGAELFAVGPLFTAPGGHGTEYSANLPEQMRAVFDAQFVRLPKTPDEALQQVAELKKRGVNGIKAVLEAGSASRPFTRMDPAILRAIAEAARSEGLPIVCHTGDSKDIADALDAGVDGIEHGSHRDLIPEVLLARMKQKGVAYDPTLAVVEGFLAAGQGKTDLLDRSLVQQVGPPKLLESTKKMLPSQALDPIRAMFRAYPMSLDSGKQNLAAATRAGVMLVTGTDAGNPLVIHGPGIHRELQLWVEAGVAPGVALQAATHNAARLLRGDDRIGLIRKGYDASLLLVDGNPLQDIAATERISMVLFKGERVARSELFEEQ